MAGIIGLIVLFLATLTMGGCAGIPNYGSGYGNGISGYGYGGAYSQPYGAALPVPVDPGYAVGGGYVVQPQPYYAPQPNVYNYPGPNVYAPAPGSPHGNHMAGPWINHRERNQAAHINPYERGRLNGRQNRASQDIYRGRHNGVAPPAAIGPQRGNGPRGPVGSLRQPGAPVGHPGNSHGGPISSNGRPQINSGQTHGGTQPQARPTQRGVAPSRSIAAPPGQ